MAGLPPEDAELSVSSKAVETDSNTEGDDTVSSSDERSLEPEGENIEMEVESDSSTGRSLESEGEVELDGAGEDTGTEGLLEKWRQGAMVMDGMEVSIDSYTANEQGPQGEEPVQPAWVSVLREDGAGREEEDWGTGLHDNVGRPGGGSLWGSGDDVLEKDNVALRTKEEMENEKLGLLIKDTLLGYTMQDGWEDGEIRESESKLDTAYFLPLLQISAIADSLGLDPSLRE